MGVLKDCFKTAEGAITGKETVVTPLRSVNDSEKLMLAVDIKRMGSVVSKMRQCFAVDIPIERMRHLQLLDEHQSATIEGANTTVDNVIQGRDGKSEIMVRDCFAGLQCLLSSGDLTEDAMINAWREITKRCCENTSAGTDGYRTGMVYVASGYDVVYTPPRPDAVPGMMKSLFNYEHEYVLVNAAVYGFYMVYVHPFADGNGRISRAVMHKIIGIPGLPLSKAINIKRKEYYHSIQKSEVPKDARTLDITPFYDFIVDSVDRACDMYMLNTKPLNAMQSLLLSKMDEPGKGFISCKKASDILGVDVDVADVVIHELQEMGYLEYSVEAGLYKLIWR